MNKSKVLVLFISVLLFLTPFLFAGGGAEEEQVVLRAAHQGAPGGFTDLAAQKFKELVEAKSKGQVTVEIYPAGQLGQIREVLEGLSMGTVDVLFEGLSWLAQYDKDLNFYNQSFMFKDPQELIDSPYQAEILEKIRQNNGIRVLSYSAVMPAMQLWTRDKPVYTLEDLKGIKIRVPGVKAYIDMWSALGSTAVSVAWSEVYMALSQNVVAGIVHDPVKIRDEKFYEHLKYCTILDFKFSLSTVYISDSKFQSLSPKIQKVLTSAAEEYAEFFNSQIEQEQDEAWDEMKKAGIEIIEIDRDPWFETAHTVHKEMEDAGTWSAGLLEKEGKL